MINDVPEERTGWRTWRYVTRCCGSVTWRHLTTKKVRENFEYPMGQAGVRLREKHRQERFICGRCSGRDTHLYDKKTNAPVKELE